MFRDRVYGNKVYIYKNKNIYLAFTFLPIVAAVGLIKHFIHTYNHGVKWWKIHFVNKLLDVSIEIQVNALTTCCKIGVMTFWAEKGRFTEKTTDFPEKMPMFRKIPMSKKITFIGKDCLIFTQTDKKSLN